MTADDVWFWDRLAQGYDQAMLLLERPIRRMLKLTGTAARGRSRVLVVAAGTGLVTSGLSREANTVIATDFAPKMLDRLRERVASEQLSNVSVEQADLYRLRFDERSFDAVFAANVLQVVPDLPAALNALRRVLKPGGVLVLPTFCLENVQVTWRYSKPLALTGYPGATTCTVDSLTVAARQASLLIQSQELIPGPIPIAYVEAICAS